MTHLRVKLRIVGSKHYKFKQILILNKLTKIRGKLFEKLGFWILDQINWLDLLY
jgi:ribosomal protein S16